MVISMPCFNKVTVHIILVVLQALSILKGTGKNHTDLSSCMWMPPNWYSTDPRSIRISDEYNMKRKKTTKLIVTEIVTFLKDWYYLG